MAKKCKNCEHSYDVYGLLTCKKLVEELDVIHPDTLCSIKYIEYSDDIASIVVKPDFSCIHWQRK